MLNNFKNDLIHETKRIYSFHRFNEILLNCSKNICSRIDENDQYHLTDISLDGFISNRAYFFYKDGLFSDEEMRYFEAERLINNVINCEKIPTLDETTIRAFEFDYKQITENEYSVKNRKAFWISMKYSCNNFHDPKKDYCGACGFVDSVKKLYDHPFDASSNIYRLKEFIKDNLHIANGMDLMRLCYVRHKIGGHLAFANQMLNNGDREKLGGATRRGYWHGRLSEAFSP